MPEHLTALDATFLELEQADPSAHMHIGGVLLFERRPVGAPPLDLVRDEIDWRLAQLPRFRQRLSEPQTGGFRWPVWMDDERFAISHHVSTAGLPRPGGRREMIEWAGAYFSQRLDRSRPLWELVVLELADGRWAMASKTHHCMVDGVGSVDIAQALLDIQRERMPPTLDGPIASRNRIQRGRGAPTWLARDLARQAAALGRRGLTLARHPATTARDALHRSRAMADLLVRDELIAAPRTSLNEPIGAHRRLAVVPVPLTRLKEIKRVLRRHPERRRARGGGRRVSIAAPPTG
jgi:diacylglycerol O-acyltransferase